MFGFFYHVIVLDWCFSIVFFITKKCLAQGDYGGVFDHDLGRILNIPLQKYRNENIIG